MVEGVLDGFVVVVEVVVVVVVVVEGVVDALVVEEVVEVVVMVVVLIEDPVVVLIKDLSSNVFLLFSSCIFFRSSNSCRYFVISLIAFLTDSVSGFSVAIVLISISSTCVAC